MATPTIYDEYYINILVKNYSEQLYSTNKTYELNKIVFKIQNFKIFFVNDNFTINFDFNTNQEITFEHYFRIRIPETF